MQGLGLGNKVSVIPESRSLFWDCRTFGIHIVTEPIGAEQNFLDFGMENDETVILVSKWF